MSWFIEHLLPSVRRGVLLAAVAMVMLLAGGQPALAEPSPEELADRLQEVYDQATGFQARFSQQTAIPMSRRQRQGEGSVMFRKPHQMRWEYEKPDHQVLVGDGREVQLYLARSNQLMISKVEDYLDSDVTYAFFAGTGDIRRDFQVGGVPVTERPPAPAGHHALRLEPRELHSQVEYLDLQVGGEPFFIRRLDIVDHFGSVTTLEFFDVELDPELPAAFYHFEPPAETEILRN